MKLNILLAILILGLVAHLLLRRPGEIGIPWFSPQRATDQSSTAGLSRSVQTLKSYQGTRLLYNLSPQDQKLLLGAVDHFCVQSYHRESCVHYLITCGVPCITVIPKPKRKRIIDDYQALRVGQKLAPLPLPLGN